MNTLLLIFLFENIFSTILSSSCPVADLLYIINHGTGYFLGIDEYHKSLVSIKKVQYKEFKNNKCVDEYDTKWDDDFEVLVYNDTKELDENDNKEFDENDNKEFYENDNKVFKEDKRVYARKRIELNKEIVLNYAYQKWCLSDVSRTFYNKCELSKKNAKNTSFVFNDNSGEKVLEIKDGELSNSVIDLIPKDKASCYGNFRIVYLPKSGMFAIRTLIKNKVGLSLSAVSFDPADGITLKPFDPEENDTLQQWIIKP